DDLLVPGLIVLRLLSRQENIAFYIRCAVIIDAAPYNRAEQHGSRCGVHPSARGESLIAAREISRSEIERWCLFSQQIQLQGSGRRLKIRDWNAEARMDVVDVQVLAARIGPLAHDCGAQCRKGAILIDNDDLQNVVDV